MEFKNLFDIKTFAVKRFCSHFTTYSNDYVMTNMFRMKHLG